MRIEVHRRGEWVLFLLVLPLIVYLAWHNVQSFGSAFSQDFRPVWAGAGAVLHWRSPYRPAATPSASRAVYPPPLFLAVAPLALLPFWVAKVIWLSLLGCASVATFLAVGVRDPKLFAAVLLSPLLLTALWFGNPTPILMLLFALMWRWRDRSSWVAFAIAAAAAVKLWPAVMIVWLIATGRRRAAAKSALATVLLITVSWAAIGFAGLRAYPSTLRTDAHDFAHLNNFVVGLVLSHNYSLPVAEAVGVLVAVFLIALALRSGKDHLAFGLSILAALAPATIVWDHYLVMLFVPIAIAAKQFSSRALWVVALGLGTASWVHDVSLNISSHTFTMTIPDYYVIVSFGLALAWSLWDRQDKKVR